MTSFPKHKRYKDSGIEWLGEVPEHWDVQSLRAVAGLYVEKNQPDLPVLSVYREYGVILKDSRDDNHNATSLDTSNYKVVRPGDLAVNKMKAWQGSLGVSEHHGIVSPAYITCRLNQEKVTGRYIHYLLRSKSLIGALDSISYGVRVGQWDMRFEDFKKVGITIPPKPEQDRIVAFLDQKTAEIDDLIAKKQRQIELLDEQKAILINRAVTRGLNPNAKLKPSGIEWIGDIPEHWTAARLGHVATLNSGGTPDRATPRFWTNATISWIKTGEIRNNHITDSEERITELAVKNSAAKLSPPGTLLMAMYGQGVTRGRVALLKIPATYNQACLAISTGDPILQKHLFWFFQVGYRYLRDDGNETSQMNLNADSVGRMRVLIPPPAEQVAISQVCEDIIGLAATVRQSVESQIQSLKTLRSNLIAHAVTGRIKV